MNRIAAVLVVACGVLTACKNEEEEAKRRAAEVTEKAARENAAVAAYETCRSQRSLLRTHVDDARRTAALLSQRETTLSEAKAIYARDEAKLAKSRGGKDASITLENFVDSPSKAVAESQEAVRDLPNLERDLALKSKECEDLEAKLPPGRADR